MNYSANLLTNEGKRNNLGRFLLKFTEMTLLLVEVRNKDEERIG